ncbi:hypothetical protein ES703_120267 [subsurface metagenome]
MVISNSTTVRSRPPIRYFTQSGIVGWEGAGGGGDGGDDSSGGDGGDDSFGDDSSGGDGGDDSFGDDGAGDDNSDGDDSVVKAPIALQALQVLESPALTFQ